MLSSFAAAWPTEFGEIAVMFGAGPALTVKAPASVLLAQPPPGDAAHTFRVPACALDETVSVPVMEVPSPETEPLKLILESLLPPIMNDSRAEVRFDPVTVTETSGPPALAEAGEIEVIAGVAPVTVKLTASLPSTQSSSHPRATA